MIRPLALYIGLRYTRAKRRSHFISFISLISMLGIGLGVAVLITVLSVMNGFDYQIRTQFFSMASPVTVVGQNVNSTWQNWEKTIDANPKVVSSAPFVTGMGILSNSGFVSGVNIFGISPSKEIKVSQLNTKMLAGRLNSLNAGGYYIVIGQKLADQLGLTIGDKVSLVTPQATTTTPFGIFPQFRQFTVKGIFKTEGGFGFDTLAFININDAIKLFPQGLKGFHVKLKDVYQAKTVSDELMKSLPGNYIVTNWTEDSGSFFKAVAMQKTIMFVILLLIVAVAVFNLVATLVMVVNEKQGDIAILRTLGASPRTIMSIFIIQGSVIGFIGTIIGVVIGVILAWNITDLVNGIQNLFHIQLINSSVYFVDFLPSRLQWLDVVSISLISLTLSLIATIYPALIAFRTEPAQTLRYE